MHSRASSWYGAVIAPVGQAGRQAVQRPQWSACGASTSSGRSVYSSPSTNQEPARGWIRLVCLPIQPRPALRASGFSITGPESTKARYPKGPISASSAEARRCRRRRTMWW